MPPLLDFQLAQAPFRTGVDEGTDPKQVPFGTLMTAQNVVWEKSGRLQKRNGTATLTTDIIGGGSLSSASRLFVRDDELCLIDASGKVYSYASNSTTGWKLGAGLGRVPEVGLTWDTLHDAIEGAQSSDVGLTADGRMVHSWVVGDPTTRGDQSSSTGRVYYQVIDRDDNSRIVTVTNLGNGEAANCVRVLVSGNNWIVIYATGGGNIRCSVNGAAVVTLRNDAAGPGTGAPAVAAFDACVVNGEIILAYILFVGGIGLYRYSIAATPAQQASGTVTGEATLLINAIAIDGAVGEPLWIAYVGEVVVGDQYFRIATANVSTLAQTLAPTFVETVVTGKNPTVTVKRVSSISCLYAYSLDNASGTGTYFEGVTRSRVVSSAGVLSSTITTYGVKLLSRPFYMGTIAYMLVTSYSNAPALAGTSGVPFGGDVSLVEVGVSASASNPVPHRYVGRMDVLIGGFWRPGAFTNVSSVSASEFLSVYPFTASAPTGFTSRRNGIRSLTLTTGASKPIDTWRSVSIGSETYLSGGVLSAWDGRQAFDYGFAGPAFINEVHALASGVGGLMASGAYIYAFHGEYRSAAGVLHRGPVGDPYTLTVPPATVIGSVFVPLIPIHLSQKQPDIGVDSVNEPVRVMLAAFRTVVNETVPQRLTVEPLYNVVLQPAVGVTSITDTRNDTEVGNGSPLRLQPALYTAGGELDDFQPPASLSLCLYRSRIFSLAGDGSTWWFSKDSSANPGVAPGFHPSFRIPFNDRMTGAAVLDERIFFFSSTGIYYMAGEGPAPNGDGSDYGTPNRLSTDVGCTNPRGIVSFPDGILFVAGDAATRSEIHVLDRKLNVSWIGQPVQDLLDTYPNVTSAVLVASKNHVRFSCLSEDGLTGIVIVYDYVEGQWTHFVYGASIPIADALIHGGAYTFVTTAGVVYKESESTYLDAGSWVTAKLETAWVHAAGPLAYHSVRNFRIDGIVMTPHALSVSVGFNGEPLYQQGPRVFAEGTIGVTTVGDVSTANISIGTRRKCRSIRFKIEDVAPSMVGTGQGVKWSMMGIEVGVKPGLGPVAAAQKG